MKRMFQLALGPVCMALGLAACSNLRHPVIRPSDYPGGVRVACVGDSITYGAGIEHRETNSYPAALGRLLGPKFETRNFGVNGATLLKKGDKPYWDQPEFAAAETFGPDLVIVKLGTNDSKPQNWAHRSEFEGDLAAMIDHFSHLRSHPKIWVCLPVPVYESRWGIDDDVLVNGIIPAIKRVAQAKNVPVIDLYYALSNRPDLFPDKIHPNAQGAELIAQTVQAAILGQ